MCINNTCPVHARVDIVSDVTEGPYYAFTYVDDKVIVTRDNPNYANRAYAVLAVLSGRPIPPMFTTEVVKLENNTQSLVDWVCLGSDDERAERMIFAQDHGSYPESELSAESDAEHFFAYLTRMVQESHHMVVDMVKSGAIA